MKPEFTKEMDMAMAVRQHVILQFNTQDRYYWPEGDIPPCNLNFFIAQYYWQLGYTIA